MQADPGVTVITLANNNRLDSFIIDGQGGNGTGVAGNPGATNTTLENLTVQNFSAAGGFGVNIAPSTNTTINNSTFTNNDTNIFLNANNTTISNVTINGGGTGISLGAGGGDITGFANISNVDIDNQSVNGIALNNAQAGAMINITDTTIDGGTGGGLQVTNSQAGASYDIDNLDIGATTAVGGTGVDIQNSAGTFDFDAASSIANPGGVAYNEGTGTADVTFNGTITQNSAASAVAVDGKTGGVTIFNGPVTANTGTAAGIALTNNTGGTITFDGGLDIDTTTGTGFSATGGGTVNVLNGVNVNTIDTTGGQALDLNSVTANIALSSISSANSPTTGITIDTLTDGSMVSVGTTTVTDAGTTGIRVQNNVGTVNIGFGATTVLDTALGGGVAGDGVTINNNSAGTRVAFDSLDINVDGSGIVHNGGGTFNVAGVTNVSSNGGTGLNLQGSTGVFGLGGLNINIVGANRGLDLRLSNVQFNADNTTITGDGSLGGIAVDLSGSMNPNGANSMTPNIILAGDAGETAIINGVGTGILMGDAAAGSAGAFFRYGNQTEPTSGSQINVLAGGTTLDTTNLVSTDPFTQGRYEFRGVTFTGEATFETSQGLFFAASTATGAGDGSSLTDLADANGLLMQLTQDRLAGQTIVLINDGGAINLGPNTANLNSRTNIDGFGNGNTVSSFNVPVNVIVTNANLMTSATVFMDPTGLGAATLSANVANNVVGLLDTHTIGNVDINGGAFNIAGTGFQDLTVSGVSLGGGATGVFSFTNTVNNGTINLVNNTVNQVGGRLLDVNGGNSVINLAGGTINNTDGSGVRVRNTTGGMVVLDGLNVTGADFTPLTFDNNDATFTIANSTFGTDAGVTLLDVDTGAGGSTSALVFDNTNTLTHTSGTIATIGASASATRNVDLSAHNFANAGTAATNVIGVVGQPAGSTISFGNVGITGFGDAATDTAVDLQGAGAVTFGDLDIVTVNGAGLNAGGITLNPGATPTIDSTGGTALALNGTTFSGGTFTFATVNATNTGAGNAGIDIDNIAGILNITNAAINGSGGSGIDIAGSTGTFNFATVDIDNTGGHGISLANNATTAVNISGGTIDGTGAGFDGINSVNTDNLTIDALTLGATTQIGGDGIQVTNTLDATLAINNTTVTDAAGAGITVDGSGGGTTTVTSLNNNTVFNAGAGGMLFETVTFDAGGGIAVTGGNTVIGDLMNTANITGDGLRLNNVLGGIDFATNLDISNNNGAGVFIRDAGGKGGTFSFATTGLDVNTAMGTAVDIDPVVLAVNANNITASGGTNGILLNTVSGTFTVAGTVDIDNTTAVGIDISNSTAAFTFNAVDIDQTTAGGGIALANNGGGTFDFNGPTTIDSTTGTGLSATGGGTLNITGAANTVNATTGGTAVNIANTTIGAGGVTFQTVTANGAGANSGVVLNNTGGQFTVSGATTIDARTAAGIDIDGAGDATFAGVTITNRGAEGIDIDGTGGTLQFGTTVISGAGGVTAGIDVAGTTGGSVTFNDTIGVTGSGGAGIALNGNTGTFAVAGTTTVDSATGASIDIDGTGDATFAGVTITNRGAEGIDIDGTSSTLQFGTTAISGAGGMTAGVDVAGTTGGSVAFNSTVAVDGSGGQGIHLANNAGSFTVTGIATLGGTAANTGVGVDIDAGTGGVTFNGLTITDRLALGIDIDAGNQALAFNGTTTIANPSDVAFDAVQVDGTTGGSVTFNSVDIDGAATQVNGIALGATADNTAAVAINGGTIDGALTGDGINSANTNLTVAGVTLGGTAVITGDGIQVTNTLDATLAINNTTVTDAAGAGITVDGSGGGTTTVTSLDSNTVSNAGAGGMLFETVTFDGGGGVNVTGGATVIGDPALVATAQITGDGLRLNNVLGGIAFATNLDITNNNGTGLFIRDNGGKGGTFSFGVTGLDVNTATGTGVDIDPVVLAVNANNITASGGTNGILLNTVSGTFTVAGTVDIDNTTAVGIDISNSTGTYTFNTVDIDQTTAGGGINLANNAGGTFDFNGPTTIDTTTGTGLSATGGGTLNVTGAANTVNAATGGTAVNIANTTIGAGGVTFQTVAANGASANFGVVLNNTGGQFTVSGATTIDARTSASIDIDGTGNATFAGVTITNRGAEGIDIDGTGGTLQFGTTAISGAGGVAGIDVAGTTGGSVTFNGTIGVTGSGGAGIALNGNTGTFTASGTTTITNTTGDGIAITNNAGTATFTGLTTVTDAGGDGIQLTANSGTTTFGATNIDLGAGGAGTQGINIEGANGQVTFGATTITDVKIGQTGIDFAGANAPFNATTVAISGTGGTGVDLTNTTGNQPINLGDPTTPAADTPSSIIGLDTGVRLTNANANFTFGDGEEVIDILSTISAIVPLDVTGFVPGQGNYNFLDVNLTNQNLGAGFGLPSLLFVDANTNGVGTATNPTNVTDAENSATADIIFLVNDNSVVAGQPNGTIDALGSNGDDTFQLDDNQQVLSFLNGPNFVFMPTVPAGIQLNATAGTVTDPTGNGAPELSTTGAGASLTLANANTLRGVNIANDGGGSAVFGDGITGTTTVDQSLLQSIAINAGSANINVTGSQITNATNTPTVSFSGGHSGTAVFDAATTIAATNGDGLQFNDADGTYNFNGTTTLNGGDAGIDILGGSAGTFTFNAPTINNAAGGVGVNIDNAGASATVTFDGLAVTTNNNTGVLVNNNTGTLTIDNTTNAATVNSTGGPAFNATGANLDVTFNSTSATNGSGIVLNNSTGAFTVGAMGGAAGSGGALNINGGNGVDINGGSVAATFNNLNVNATGGTAVNINGTSGNISFVNSDISQLGVGRLFEIDGATAGNILFDAAGTLSATVAGNTGARINNTDANVTVANMTLANTGGTQAVDIDGGSGQFQFNNAAITNATGVGIDVDNHNGLFTFLDGVIDGAGTTTQGIDIDGGTGNVIINRDANLGTVSFTNIVDDAINVANRSGTVVVSDIIVTNIGGDTIEATNTGNVDVTNGLTLVNLASGNFINQTGTITIDNATLSNLIINGGNANYDIIDSTFNNATNTTTLSVINGHSGNVDFDAATAFNVTNGDGLQFNNADGNYTFNGATTLNGGDAGIDILGGSAGTFTFAGLTQITNNVGVAVNMANSPGTATFNNLDINQSVGNGVQASNSGALSITGSIDNVTGDGINVTNTNLTANAVNIGANAAIGDDGIEIVNSDATARTAMITNSNIFPLAGTGIANRGIFINSSGTGTLTATVTTNQISSTNQAILTNDGGSPGSLVLDLQNSTLTRATAGFTQQHVGSGLNSTIVRSWSGPNQVTSNPGGGILFKPRHLRCLRCCAWRHTGGGGWHRCGSDRSGDFARARRRLVLPQSDR